MLIKNVMLTGLNFEDSSGPGHVTARRSRVILKFILRSAAAAALLLLKGLRETNSEPATCL